MFITADRNLMTANAVTFHKPTFKPYGSFQAKNILTVIKIGVVRQKKHKNSIPGNSADDVIVVDCLSPSLRKADFWAYI